MLKKSAIGCSGRQKGMINSDIKGDKKSGDQEIMDILMNKKMNVESNNRAGAGMFNISKEYQPNTPGF